MERVKIEEIEEKKIRRRKGQLVLKFHTRGWDGFIPHFIELGACGYQVGAVEPGSALIRERLRHGFHKWRPVRKIQ